MDFDLENPFTSSDDSITALFAAESDHCLVVGDGADLPIRRDAVALILQAQFSCGLDPFVTYLAINYVDRFLIQIGHNNSIFRCTVTEGKAMGGSPPRRLLSLPRLQDEARRLLPRRFPGRRGFNLRLPDDPSHGASRARRSRLEDAIHHSFLLPPLLPRLLLPSPTPSPPRPQVSRLGDRVQGPKRYQNPYNTISFPRIFGDFFSNSCRIICLKIGTEIKMLEFEPSLIAASALLSAAYELFPIQFPAFRSKISSCEFVNKERFFQCCNAIGEMAMGCCFDPTAEMVSSTDTPVTVFGLHSTSSESERTVGSTD